MQQPLFLMLRHRAILYIVRTPARWGGGLFAFFVLSFSYKTQTQSSTVRSSDYRMALSTTESSYLQGKETACAFYLPFELCILALAGTSLIVTRKGCTVTPCRTGLCRCAGRDRAGGQAKKEDNSLKNKQPCVRMHLHPAALHSPCTSDQNKTLCRPAIQEFQPLLLLIRRNSKTTSASILFGCVIKHVWEYRPSPIHL